MAANPHSPRRTLLVLALVLAGTLPARATLTYANFPEFVDPHPASGNDFGAVVLPLSTGNVVVTSPGDDAGGSGAGAVYLFNGATGALISTLTGSYANDQLGSGGIVAVGSGNFVVLSPLADYGGTTDVGRADWASGTTGFDVVATLRGSSTNDKVGYEGITVLTNGNYVVKSSLWDNGAIANAGAATWCGGNAGLSAAVSSANSMIGLSAGDGAGYSVTALSNGSYVVQSYSWDNGATADVGAVRWGNGTFGSTGAITAATSLHGSTAGDNVGDIVVPLTNGAYVVRSTAWDNGAATDAGAVTFCSSSGTVGTVSSANSLVGSSTNDQVGSAGVVALANGNYVVASPFWNNTSLFADIGAVTWCSGTTGRTGTVSTGNSLCGSVTPDHVGNGGVFALSNGNYVVASPSWANGSATGAGAVTWCNGTTGRTGTISSANSIVGSTTNDGSATTIVELTNGAFVSVWPHWDNGAVVDAGAVLRGSGAFGGSGVIYSGNALIGSTANDLVGNGGVYPLANGNYVVASPDWDTGGAVDAGAATFGNGATGVVGAVSAANSLVGSHADDRVAAPTFGDAVLALANGNYVVRSIDWKNGAAASAGAVTWGSGTTGVTGFVSSANSLVGNHASDFVGFQGFALPGGDYVVSTAYWDYGAAADAGAVTWCSGATGRTGTIDATNSLVGGKAGDQIGYYLRPYANAHYVSLSSVFSDGSVVHGGAATPGDGTTGLVGIASVDNSVVGQSSSSGLATDVTSDPVNGTFIVRFSNEGNGRLRVGPNKPFRATSLVDIPADQGGWLRLTFERSFLDHLYASPPVLTYGVWRHVPGTTPALAAPSGAAHVGANELRDVSRNLPASLGAREVDGRLVVTVPARGPASPASSMPPGTWELVATVPAMQMAQYTVALPTISNLASNDFVVTAHTSNPTFWYVTGSVNGQSVDNLAPAAPVVTNAAYAAGATHIDWTANVEHDLAGYNVYRGSSAGFTPSAANRISTHQLSTSIADPGPAGNWYKLSAVDVNGNESVFAVVTPSGTTDVANEPVAFSLEGVRPNPASTHGLHVAFALPADAPATLELLDVSGRRVVVRDVGGMGAGRHVVNLANESRVTAGVFWVRLTQGVHRRSSRVAVVE